MRENKSNGKKVGGATEGDRRKRRAVEKREQSR